MKNLSKEVINNELKVGTELLKIINEKNRKRKNNKSSAQTI